MTPLTAEQVLARVRNIPALPKAVHELQAALQDDSVQTDRIVRTISVDQGLTITALKLANSSFYGVSGRVVTLRDAVQILGLQTLSSAVMTAAVMARFDRSACPTFDVDGCWRHAIATALCAKIIAQMRGLDECAAYTAGLLHDVGRLALAVHFPNEHAAATALGAEHDLLPLDAECALLGIDHAAVGGMVAAHWRLAPSLVETIRSHHDLQPSERPSLLDVLHLADNITHALDLSQAPDDIVPPLSPEVWERLELTGTELQTLFERLERAMQDLAPARCA